MGVDNYFGNRASALHPEGRPVVDLLEREVAGKEAVFFMYSLGEVDKSLQGVSDEEVGQALSDIRLFDQPTSGEGYDGRFGRGFRGDTDSLSSVAGAEYVVGKRVYETSPSRKPASMFVSSSRRWVGAGEQVPSWLGTLFPYVPPAPGSLR